MHGRKQRAGAIPYEKIAPAWVTRPSRFLPQRSLTKHVALRMGSVGMDLTKLDKHHLWHPFTPMRQWCAEEHTPLMLVEGRGCTLRDQFGNEYLDGNASIWTNVHGHNHPVINAAITEQLGKVAHTSFLGFHPRTGDPTGEGTRRSGAGREADTRFFHRQRLHGHRICRADGLAVLEAERQAAARHVDCL
jgi:hypothetical protein